MTGAVTRAFAAKGIEITSRPDKSLTRLLLDGDIDAINAAHPPEPFAQRSPEIKRLFPNYREVEENYYRETGIWPIMHFFAIRREVFGEDFFPYGIEPNRKTLEAFLLYTYEQGLAHRHLEVEDLFPPELHSEFSV